MHTPYTHYLLESRQQPCKVLSPFYIELLECYGVNDCAPSKEVVEVPVLSVMVFGGRILGQVLRS